MPKIVLMSALSLNLNQQTNLSCKGQHGGDIAHHGLTPASKCDSSPPLECIFDHIPFSRRWDTGRYSGIQLDMYGYSWIQWDTAGYSGSAAKVDRYRLI